MIVWESSDLVMSLNRANTGARQPTLASFSMPDGNLRGMIGLPLPDVFAGLNAPIGLTIQPDNQLIWARTAATGENDFDNSIVYSNGEAGDLHVDRPSGPNNIGSMAFDSAGNRYMGDFDSDLSIYLVRKVDAITNVETVFPIADAYIADGTVDGIGLPPDRIFVNQAGTMVYWHAQALFPFNPSIFTGFNRMNLATGEVLRRFDIRDFFPTSSEHADFGIGPVTGYIYLFFGGLASLPWVAVINPTTDDIVNMYNTGNSDCSTGLAAINCDETILAYIHADVGFTNIELREPMSGAFIGSVDYEGQTGLLTPRGMTFARCPDAGVVFPGFAKAPRVGSTQEWFTRTTP